MCRSTSGCWRNCVSKNSSITRCACRVPQRYCTTISVGFYEPYTVSASTLTFLISLHITYTTVRTTVQHYALPSDPDPYPYVFLTKWSWNASSSESSLDQNAPHFPRNSLASICASMWRPKSIFMPSLRFSIWSCKDLDASDYTTLNPPRALHKLGVCIVVRGVVDSLPNPNPPKIGGTSVLNAKKTMYISFVFRTLAARTSSCCNYAVNTTPPVIKWR